MESNTTRPSAFLGSFRALGESLLATVRDRLELFSVELQEEKFRLIQTFIWISAAVFSAMMALTFASLTLVYLLWEGSRLAVLGGLAAFYLLALVAIVIGFRRFIARQPSPFMATRGEIDEDRACIRNEN